MRGLTRSRRRLAWRVGIVAALALVTLLSRQLGCGGPGSGVSSGGGAGPAIEELFEERRSGTVVELEGRVERVLADDDRGSRHQRFVLELGSGHTVLIAHNIDLAPRAPVRAGDRVEVRGQYEWNDRGGVIHWTHHDPGGRRPGGWLRVGGREYR